MNPKSVSAAKKPLIETPRSKLNPQQKYLLDRLPRRWTIGRPISESEPPKVRAARTVISRYERGLRIRSKRESDRIDKILREAREQIYFGDLNRALRLIKKLEAERNPNY
jgi:hypothetical protein